MVFESPERNERLDLGFDLAAIAVLLIASALALWTWRDYGISWDEIFHLEYGRHIHAFFSSGFEDKNALSYRLDYLYGGGFDLAGALFCELAAPRLDRYDAIHLFGILIGIAGLWGTWKLGRVLAGPRAGLLAAAFIAGTSVYWGHMANNPKDMPFAVGYVWAMAYLVEAIRSFPKIPSTLALKLSLAIGLAMSVRIAGLLLLCYLAAAIAAWLGHQAWHRRNAEAVYRYARGMLGTGLAIAIGAWLVMLSAWPWALYDPIARPFAALRRMSQFMGHRREMPFAGEMISTYDVDWRYMPHYFGLKLPEFVVVLFVLGLGVGLVSGLVLGLRKLDRSEHVGDTLVLGTLALSLLFPWVYAVVRGSILYDGLRHFLFEVPVLIASVACVADRLIAWLHARAGRGASIAAGALLALACVDQYATMVRLHPHQYVYFNRFIGGLEGAVGNYDTDYYASSYADAGEQLADQLWRDEPERFLHTRYVVAGCGGALKTTRKMPPNFSFRSKRPDFWLGYTRDNCHLRHPNAPIVFELEREGGVLIVVRDLRAPPKQRPREATP